MHHPCEPAHCRAVEADISRVAEGLNKVRRLLACIRWPEVLLLQATPAVGAILTIEKPTGLKLINAGVMLAADTLLLAHIWTLNDWADIDADLSNPKRSNTTFTERGVSRAAMLQLSAFLVLLSFGLFTLLPGWTLSTALLIAALGWLYSAPPVYGKGRCVLSSVLHFLGGCFHFVLGCSIFGSPASMVYAQGILFGLVFAAGHAIQEVEDHDADRLRGIRTNAVVFGKFWQFGMGCLLFAAAYLYLAFLAHLRLVPGYLGIVSAAAILVQAYCAFEVKRRRCAPAAVRRFRQAYRCLFATIGVMLILGVLC